ncbi:hypothetical protein DAEQUDRAFT_729494 [Daedalea quercina L-15889]|uniref:N-acetyltransferase domain-containing protein n=1 Tax=Daedalea quercina L-15889 TaxID=1314783 RepID=A0A165NKL6_9APHY|nr:hypothetical protein DAEQUDRAFT_729494 [Daedalea quercina L-15889]
MSILVLLSKRINSISQSLARRYSVLGAASSLTAPHSDRVGVMPPDPQSIVMTHDVEEFSARDGTRQPLLGVDRQPSTSYVRGEPWKDIDVEPMRYVDIPKILNTFVCAFANDPLYDYIEDSLKESKSRRGTRFYFQWWGRLASMTYAGQAYTVDNGEAVMFMRPPGRKRGLVERVLERISMAMATLGVSAEQQRRIEERYSKSKAAVEEAFGDRLDHMFQMAGLATHPDKQGRGYGKALMTLANAKADQLGVASYIKTSAGNVAFYESCGYVVVGRFTLGDDNPNWTRPPVALFILLRDSSAVAA